MIVKPKVSYRIIFLFLGMILMISCVPVKKLLYVNDIDELQEPIVNPREHKLIMPYDKLYIKVYSIDEKTNSLFSSSESMNSNSNSGMIGYQVDEAGNIYFPFVGKIHVGGMSTNESGVKLLEALNEYTAASSVIVKFIENNVSVLGEVQRQGNYTFSQDKISIYEALALGGGLSQYGNRKDVILIRQEGDKIIHHKLDLTDSRIAGKDFYYIQSNDVIIVEPMKLIRSNYGNNIFSLALSSISSLIAVILFVRVL